MSNYTSYIIYMSTRACVKMMFATILLCGYLIITFLPFVAIITAMVNDEMSAWGRIVIGGMGVMASIVGRPITILAKSLKNI